MIPESVGAFVALLTLVVPGLVFEMLRERRRPARDSSAFREASRTAVWSLAFSGSALVVLALVRLGRSRWIVDLGDWVADGSEYFRAHTTLVLWNLAAFVGVSVALVVLIDRRLGGHSTLVKDSLWQYIFRTERPDNKATRVSVTLTSGDRVIGYVERYSTTDKPDDADIYLVGPKLEWIPALADGNATEPDRRSLDKWDGVHVRGSQISWLRFRYVDNEESAGS